MRHVFFTNMSIKSFKIDTEYSGVEGHALTARAPESQLTEQSLTGRHWNSPKKIPHIQRQRRSHNNMVGRAQSQ